MRPMLRGTDATPIGTSETAIFEELTGLSTVPRISGASRRRVEPSHGTVTSPSLPAGAGRLSGCGPGNGADR